MFNRTALTQIQYYRWHWILNWVHLFYFLILCVLSCTSFSFPIWFFLLLFAFTSTFALYWHLSYFYCTKIFSEILLIFFFRICWNKLLSKQLIGHIIILMRSLNLTRNTEKEKELEKEKKRCIRFRSDCVHNWRIIKRLADITCHENSLEHTYILWFMSIQAHSTHYTTIFIFEPNKVDYWMQYFSRHQESLINKRTQSISNATYFLKIFIAYNCKLRAHHRKFSHLRAEISRLYNICFFFIQRIMINFLMSITVQLRQVQYVQSNILYYIQLVEYTMLCDISLYSHYLFLCIFSKYWFSYSFLSFEDGIDCQWYHSKLM